MIRPQPARWFEAVCARDDAFVLLEALALQGCAEIEWHAGGDEAQAARANQYLKDFGALARRHRAYWPARRLRAAAPGAAPLDAFASALRRLEAWAQAAGGDIAALQAADGELADLEILARVLEHLAAAGLDAARVADAGGALRARILVYPPGIVPAIPAAVLVHRFVDAQRVHAIVLGAVDAVEALEREAVALRGRALAPPSWLAHAGAASRAQLEERAARLRGEAAARRAAIAASIEAYEVALALGDIARAAWCFEHAGAVEGGTGLARITGWSDDPARLAAAVEASGARALVEFPAPPANASPPLVLRNPAWARPFELFVRLFGVPGREGADPSMLLAIATPLIFGYMFGDAGQGLVLLAAGLALRRRWPALQLLVPAGAAAIAFGLAFGCVFAREDVIAPLWVAPLAAPVQVLAVPLFAGALLLATGLALQALEAWWRHEFTRWLQCEAGLVAVYLGLLLAPFHAAGLALAAAGALAFIAGRALHQRRLGAPFAAAGALVERTLQILVNTVSFARVGAFALAHAGLSAAVVALAAAAGGGARGAAVLVLGNAVVIVLEGLVVGIQTTRLVLFEFFVRFLDSRGREFRPLPPPQASEVPP